MLKQLPIGISTFSELIEKNYVYIDKTDIIHNLVTNKKYYFLNRPRRFGKSLLVSTLENIFLGNKELFSGLAIDSLSYDWKQYPVISMSFADIGYRTAEELENGIIRYLQHIAKSYNIPSSQEKIGPGAMLRSLVMTLAGRGVPVVLLIDKYDYPILQHIHDAQTLQAIGETLKSFYAVIKGLDKYLRFVLLTGVSKFSQTSIFSGLNNLEDIGLDGKFNPLLGYTHAEITTYFKQHLIDAAEYNQCSIEQLLSEITIWYDGYLFTDAENAVRIYNPFSVLLFLSKKKFDNYWFKTGTPTFLINLLQTSKYQIQDFENIKATSRELDSFDIDLIPLKTLLYQTGYLTIRSYNAQIYTLTYPNKETSGSLFDYLFEAITHKSSAFLSEIATSLLHAFESNDLNHVQAILIQFFASIPYTMHLDKEKYYQLAFYIILKMIGSHSIAEEQTNVGAIDFVLQTKTTIWIIELKINKTAASALKQIITKAYYQKYEGQGKKILLVGISFDTMLKNVKGIDYIEYGAQQTKPISLKLPASLKTPRKINQKTKPKKTQKSKAKK